MGKYQKQYVDDDGIYLPIILNKTTANIRIITREAFIEAYNKWIVGIDMPFIGQDDADDWSED